MKHDSDLTLYRRVYALLLVLTVATVAASWLGENGRIVAVGIALAIATVKASLIGFYFMHLKDERPLVWGILGTGILAVIILAIGIFPDVAVRAGQ